jgi:hypothetical protein
MTKLLPAGLVALLGFAVATPAALAGKSVNTSEHGVMKVHDDAGVFHPDSVVTAENKFHGVTFKSPTHLTVRTMKALPADKRADFEATKGNETARRSFAAAWAKELAQSDGERGVYVLVCVEAKLLEVLADRQTDKYRNFDDADAGKVRDAFRTAFTRAEEAKDKSEDEKRAIRGEGLVKATDIVIGQLKNTSAPEATGGTHSDSHEPKKAGMPWWGWVLIVAGVLLVIWIIVALIRAMTGNVYGGMYGGGYGGYGYGGGGPGFFGMFMGGMLGSMAGMWLYNSMMGTHYAHDPSVAGDTGAADAGADNADTGAGDFDNGAEAGGDWGDGGGDAGGGGDWGASDGGGDWGGDGGGGDWGGGGGDFGGGGDW